jgi:hypothetical protein
MDHQSLSCTYYTKKILEKYGMLDNTPFKVPMARTHYRDGEVVSDQNKMALMPPQDETFRAILGFVNFLCMCTKPNIAFAISVVSMRHIAPMQLHIKQLNRLRVCGATSMGQSPWESPTVEHPMTTQASSRCFQTQTGQRTRPLDDRIHEKRSC